MTDNNSPSDHKVLRLDESSQDTDFEPLWKEIHQLNIGQRFGIHPSIRIPLIFVGAGLTGFVIGFSKSVNHSSLRFLAENLHRLPRNKAGWYFYHKTKNYVVLKDGIVGGVRQGVKFSIMSGTFFGLEALIDNLRGGPDRIDFTTTVLASVICGGLYSEFQKSSRHSLVQTSKNMRLAFAFGCLSGLTQDLLRYLKGDHVWYVDEIKKLWAQKVPA